MSIAEKLAIIAENEPKVFEAGKQERYDEFWNAIQQNGNRTDYQSAFGGVGWTRDVFKPKYDIKPTFGGSTGMFHSMGFEGSLKEHLESIGITLDVSRITNSPNMFYNATKITEVPFLDFSGVVSYIRYLFYSCTSLKTAHIKLGELVTELNGLFYSCIALENLTVDGVIGVSGFDVHWSTKLSRNSILSILNACTKESAGVSLTLPKKCIDGSTVTESYIANDTELNTALANATNNGYTIAYS